jgi:hypothetical protein
MVDRYLEALDRGDWEGRTRRKLVAAWPDSMVWEEEERADMWGPHVSDRGERRRCSPKAQTHEGNVFRRGRQGSTGLLGRLGEASAWEEEWAGAGELGRLPRKVSKWKFILKFK